MTSNAQVKIREIRSKLQALNQARKAHPALAEVKSKQQTTSNIFNNIQGKLKSRSTASKREIEALTLKLVELSQESAKSQETNILAKFDSLFEEVLGYQTQLFNQYQQITESGYHDIRFVLGEKSQRLNGHAEQINTGAEIQVPEVKEIKTTSASVDTTPWENQVKSLESHIESLKIQAEKDARSLAKKETQELERQQEIALLKLKAEEDTKKWQQTVRNYEAQVKVLSQEKSTQSSNKKPELLIAKHIQDKDLKIISGYIKKVTKSKVHKLDLIYTASEHEFQSAPFKSTCFGKPNLLVVAIGVNGGPFGFFCDTSYGEQTPANVGFMFSIMYSRIIKLLPGEIAVPEHQGGPAFGTKGGFIITENKAISYFDTENSSFEKVELEKWVVEEPRKALFGEEETTLNEYCVYQVIFQ